MMELPTRGAPAAAREWFSRALRERLRDLSMAQSDLARKMGTSRDNVSGWARGETWPRPDMLEKIAQALDCKIEDLVPPEMIKSPNVQALGYEAIYNQRTGRIRIRMDMELPAGLGLKIYELVHSAKP